MAWRFGASFLLGGFEHVLYNGFFMSYCDGGQFYSITLPVHAFSHNLFFNEQQRRGNFRKHALHHGTELTVLQYIMFNVII